MIKKRYGIILALGLLIAAAVGAVVLVPKAPRGPRPSIIMIVVDTLRPDYLGCYDHSLDTSPNVDAFAADSMLFESCYAQAPNTRMSCATILSGYLPHETHSMQRFDLPPEVDTLPEMLKPLGYKTVAVISNYVLRTGEGYEQGFDVFDDEMNQKELVRKHEERIAEPTTDRAIEYLEEYRDEPLFMWIHYQDPHGPYTPPAQYGQMMQRDDVQPRPLPFNPHVSGLGGIPTYQRVGDENDYHDYVARYNGEIRYFDDHFGRLIGALKRLGYYDDALIIFTSDHGEGMGEQNVYFAHGTYLYNSLTRVPLIIRQGDALKGRRQDIAQHLDFTPTILTAAGGEKLNANFRGADLRQPLGDGREVFAEARHNGVSSMAVDGMKLIVSQASRRVELYDLNTDPHEQNDLSREADHHDQLQALYLRARHYGEADLLALDVDDMPRVLSADEWRKMRSLGYTR